MTTPILTHRASRVRAKRELLEQAAREYVRTMRDASSSADDRAYALGGLAQAAKELVDADEPRTEAEIRGQARRA